MQSSIFNKLSNPGCGKVGSAFLSTFPQPLRRLRQGSIFIDGQINLANLPLLIDLHQDSAGQVKARSLIGEDPNPTCMPLDFTVEALQPVVGWSGMVKTHDYNHYRLNGVKGVVAPVYDLVEWKQEEDKDEPEKKHVKEEWKHFK
jgi:hypothetical protein